MKSKNTIMSGIRLSLALFVFFMFLVTQLKAEVEIPPMPDDTAVKFQFTGDYSDRLSPSHVQLSVKIYQENRAGMKLVESLSGEKKSHGTLDTFITLNSKEWIRLKAGRADFLVKARGLLILSKGSDRYCFTLTGKSVEKVKLPPWRKIVEISMDLSDEPRQCPINLL